jgi:plastocyanin
MRVTYGIAALLVLSWSGYANAVEATPAAISSAQVTMAGAYFEPQTVTIHIGDTVVWHNKSPYSHTVTFDPSQAEKSSEVRLPAGVAPFDSGKIGPNKDYAHTFAAPGTYDYVCVPHEDMGMVGKIVVQP